jgi:hypothetical protein
LAGQVEGIPLTMVARTLGIATSSAAQLAATSTQQMRRLAAEVGQRFASCCPSREARAPETKI